MKQYRFIADKLSELHDYCMEHDPQTIAFVFIGHSEFGAGLVENETTCYGQPNDIEDMIYKMLRNNEELMLIFGRAVKKAIEEYQTTKP